MTAAASCVGVVWLVRQWSQRSLADVCRCDKILEESMAESLVQRVVKRDPLVQLDQVVGRFLQRRPRLLHQPPVKRGV